MSTKKKGGGVNIDSFLRRQHDLSTVRDKFILSIRIYRNLLVEREATERQWGEIAGMINVCGIFAKERANSPRLSGKETAQGWLHFLIPAAQMMNNISERNSRVGGRWVATEEEAALITEAINVIDDQILLSMAATDFLRIATALNKGKFDN